MNRRRSPAALCLALLVSSCAPLREPVEVPPPPAATRPERPAVDPQVSADLRRSAQGRTSSAGALLAHALAEPAEATRHDLLLRALDEYGLAAREWTRFFALDPDAGDAAETRYWIADAWYRIVTIEEAASRTPSPEELDAAHRAAVSARATNSGAYREGAAHMVVLIADLALALQHRLHARTHGALGVEERREIRTTGEGAATRVVKDPLPREVEDAIAARDAYLDQVPAGDGAAVARTELAYQAAELHFLYGHFAEAKRRLAPFSDATRCGPDEIGYRAWNRLISMASLEGDIPAARALAQARSRSRCNPDGPGPSPPGLVGIDAYRLFQRAEKSPAGPGRDKLWREAAAAYDEALHRAPDSDEAPELAINGAYAYKQVGAYAEALALYRFFLSNYGSERALALLAHGDPRAVPPRPPDPRWYGERRKYAQMAAQQLADAEVLSLDYARAAESFDALAANGRFEPQARRQAARNAAILHVVGGERDRARAARQVVARLAPPPGELAEVDWFVAHASLALWDERAPDAGPNRAARLAAIAEVERVATEYSARAEAARWVVHAAHTAARLRRAGRDPQAAAWCGKAVRAFDALRAADRSTREHGSAEADLAGSCAQAALDAEIRADFGGAATPRRYRGDAAAIERAFLSDLARVEAYDRRIEDLARRFGPGPWLVAARATQASLVEACRAGLAPLATDERLRRALRGAEAKAIRATIEVVVLAEALRVAPAEVVEARRRLALLARLLGEPAMQASSVGISDPVHHAPFFYREGMFSSPPGLTAEGGDLLAPPPLLWE